MSNVVTAGVDISVILQDKLNKLSNDSKTMLQIHNLLAEMCDPYVPMENGNLAQTIEVTPEHVRYISPYAHYQYMGILYSPSIPIIEDGMVVGWWSPPTKYPTDRRLQYSTEQHPLASSEWDKAMLRDKRDEFEKKVTDILKERAGKV